MGVAQKRSLSVAAAGIRQEAAAAVVEAVAAGVWHRPVRRCRLVGRNLAAGVAAVAAGV